MPADALTRFFTQVVLVSPGSAANPCEQTGIGANPMPTAGYFLNTSTLMWEPWTGSIPGVGDASAANQLTQTSRLEAIRDRLPSALIGGRLGVDIAAAAALDVNVSNFPGTQPVSGPLTDAQLRALAVAISAASLPLPTGASTEATLAAIKAKTDNLDVLLSTRTKPADTQPISAASLPLPADAATQTTLVALLTELALKADLTETQPVSAAALPLPTGAATGAKQDTLLTELQLKADLTETQPVSAASLPLPTGAATSARQDTLLTELQLKADLTETQPVSLAVLPTAGGKTLTFVKVDQSAAGTTALAAADAAKKHKVVGSVMTMSADGTLKFTDTVADLTGQMDIAAKGGFVLPTSQSPYFQTGAINRGLDLVTTVGLAKGVVAILTEA